MASIKSFSEIVATMIERLNLVQPNLDTKPGTVARDLFVDLQADELQRIYRLLSVISDKQSFATAVGKDLDRLAANFGVSRRAGSPASGIVIFTASDLNQDLPIPTGTTVSARNGVSFKTIGNFSMLASEKSRYAANAQRLREVLDISGISDQYAVEIPVEATTAGTTGNLSSFQIVETDTRFDFQVTNANSMTGGSDSENDSQFRTRFLSTFSGSNTGTSLGYRNAILSLQGVLDALIVEPGNTLMLRDGTEVLSTDSNSRILSSGTGGKVDAYVLGNKLDTITESFVFRNKSYTGTISDDVNDHILGVFNQDTSLTSEERKYIAFRDGNLPFQPVSSVLTLNGSSSGVLTEATLNADGTYSGNYILVKDLNADTGGTPFGFDRIKFVNNFKNVVGEPTVKSGKNIADRVSFTNIDNLSSIYQDITVSQENSKVSIIDPSIIKVKHTPFVKVNSVSNFTTGEVYNIENSMLDESGQNFTGEFKISGKNLPNIGDKLKVSYVWRKYFDENKDYSSNDNIYYKDVIPDSVNWSVSNGVSQESSVLLKDSITGSFTVDTAKNISSVKSVFFYEEAEGEISLENNQKVVDLSAISGALESVISIVVPNESGSSIEVFDTKKSDGYISNKKVFLPTDTGGLVGDSVIVQINKIEIYNLENNDGTFNGSTIELPEESVLTAEGLLSIVNEGYLTQREVLIDYSADQLSVVPTTPLTQLPISSSSNSNFLLNSGFSQLANSNQPIEFVYDNNLPARISKYSPTNLKIDTSGIVSQGKISVQGVTANRYTVEVFAGNSYDGATISLRSEIENLFGKDKADLLFVSKVNNVYFSNVEADINGYKINNNLYDLKNSKQDSSLDSLEIGLSYSGSLSSGSIIKVDIYLSEEDGFEELYFYQNESRYTQNMFYTINKINIVSGFRSTTGSLIGNIAVSQFMQPESNTIYFSDYDFLAPREGERITAEYNINNLIREATQAIEQVRPVTADVLVKEAQELVVDTAGTIVVDEDFQEDSDSVVENVNNAVANLLNSGTLGGIIDYSDIIQVATSIQGVDSVNVSLFNYSGGVGRRTFVKSLDNQTIVPGLVSFEAVSRKNFRIS